MATEIALLKDQIHRIDSNVSVIREEVERLDAALYRGNGAPSVVLRLSKLEVAANSKSEPISVKVLSLLITGGAALGCALIQGVALVLSRVLS